VQLLNRLTGNRYIVLLLFQFLHPLMSCEPATKLPTAFNCQQQPCCCQPTGNSILTTSPTAAAFVLTCRLVAEQLLAFRRQPQQLQAHAT
jgi:hypothetical protein